MLYNRIVGIQVEFNPDLALRHSSEFHAGRRERAECLPEQLVVGQVYDFLKRDQRNYWFGGEVPLLETKGEAQLSKPLASILILEATHFNRNGVTYTRGKYRVTEVFTDEQVHFNSYAKINDLAKVRLGIGVFVFRDGKFLMGQRQGSHGADSWSVPGGHLESGETWEETARREVLEETGVAINKIRFGAVTNDIFTTEQKHYVTIWMLSEYLSGEPTIKEPDKFIQQDWFDFEHLPTPLFLPWQQLLNSQFISEIKQISTVI